MDRGERPSILFVDDDSQVLQGFRAAMSGQPQSWQVDYLDEPRSIADVLARREVDVVVTDLVMPHMDGVDVLATVRALQPQAVRIVLAEDGQETALLRAIPFAHQWLGKGCSADELRAAVAQAVCARSFVHRDDLRCILGNAHAVPSIPRLYAEVVRLLADPDVEMQRVVAVVERDPGMAAKILQLANSAMFRPSAPLSSIAEATMRIGSRTLANCVLAAELFVTLPRGDQATRSTIEEIELIARRQSSLLARMCEERPDLVDLLPTAGLLHEIGAIVLVQFDPLSYRATRRLSPQHRVAGDELERRLIGASHAQIAASLLGTWGLPWPLVDLLANHHDEDRCYAPGDPCTMLHAAEVLVAAPWRLPELEHRAKVNGFGDRFARWREMAQES